MTLRYTVWDDDHYTEKHKAASDLICNLKYKNTNKHTKCYFIVLLQVNEISLTVNSFINGKYFS